MDSLRIDLFTCDKVDLGPGNFYCSASVSNPTHVASCNTDPAICKTNTPYQHSGKVSTCRKDGAGCKMDSGFATCWYNPGDPTQPPVPTDSGGGGTCGASCNTSADCASGYSCTNDKVCWHGTACGGETASKHRIRVKALDCNNNGASGIKIRAWGNTCITGSGGTCYLFKNTACQDSVGGDQIETSVVAGYDVDASQPYFSRVSSPTFARQSCATINCNYRGAPITADPYREAYYLSHPATENENTWISKACSMGESDANTGFDFQQLHCPSPTPVLQLQPPTCSKNNWPTAIAAGSSASFSAVGQDPDTTSGTTTPSLNFYFTKQQSTSYCSIGTGPATQGKWQQVGSTINAMTGAVTLNTSGLPAGSYVMTTNVRDNDNQFSTGNPGPPLGCGFPSNSCQGMFTITSGPTVAPSISPTHIPTVSPTPSPPIDPPFSVQVNVWEGNNCSVTSMPTTNPFMAAIGVKLNGQTTASDLPIQHTITVPGLISGQTSIFQLKNLPSGWSRASCSSGTVSRQQFSQGPINFWVEQAVGPWWQSAAGDIYGFVVESAIPAISNGFLSLKLGLTDPGVFLWGNSRNIPDNQIRETSPVLKALTNPSLQENYAYFDVLTRDFEKIVISGNSIPPLPTMSPNRQATLLKKSGDLFLNSSWGSSRKLVVFVDGNLKINANQSVPVGSYLQFIVKGTITVAGSVIQLEGMYSSDGNIEIESSSNRFVSKGSLVSFGTSGIESRRSLSGVDNNTQAATVFEFRPDLVINTPREMRSTVSTWSEVSPD